MAFTAEACTNSGDHALYTITNAAKRVWDRAVAITVYEDAVPTVEAYTINRLCGTITFANVDAGRGAVTVDGSYLPMSTAARAKQFAFTITMGLLDDSDFASVQANGGMVSRIAGLGDITGSIGRHWTVDTYFSDALVAGVPVVLEFYYDIAAITVPDVICWALLGKEATQSAVDGLVGEDIEFQGTTDADNRAFSLT